MRVLCEEQRTPEWHAARVGFLCASRAKDMLATIKSGEAAARRDLRAQLVLERLTNQPQEGGFVNAEMQRGIDKEAEALGAYEALSGNLVRPVGFLAHDTLMAGCSPDGLIGDYGGLELKVPKSATHLGYWRSAKSGKAPAEHFPQLTHGLWITGRQWWDFVSFDDRFPEPLQVFRVRVYRQDVDLEAYEAAVKAFLGEVQREVDEVSAMVAA